jgi:alpha-tubulin suppressor-like RCC1 family protein
MTIHLGESNTYITTASGKIYAWGSNDYGQLG